MATSDENTKRLEAQLDKLDNKLDTVNAKVDDTNDHLASIDITLAQQHISLKEHIRRTTLLETQLVPIKLHVDRVSGALKLITYLAAIGGLIALIKSFI